MGAQLRDLAFADLDSDGRDELYAVSEIQGELIVLRIGDGNTVNIDGRLVLEGDPVSMTPFVLGSQTRLAIAAVFPPSLFFTGRSDSGVLTVETTFALTGDPARILFADYTNDRIGDSVILSAYNGELTVFAGNQDGSFQEGRYLAIGRDTSDLALIDVEGDGEWEVLMADLASDRLTLYRIIRGEFLFPKKSWSVGREPVSVAVGDFDGDGFPDAVTANRRDGTLSLLTSNGIQSLIRLQTVPVMPQPSQVLFQDLNSDGLDELIVTGQGVKAMYVYGYPNLEQPVRFETAAEPIAASVGELNGDGIPDFATIGEKDSGVTVYLSKPGVSVEDWMIYDR